jgi:hypothetical protein
VLLAVAAAVAALLAVAIDLLAPTVARRWQARSARVGPTAAPVLQDPGRERRAEQRARALLQSCVNPEDWELYRDLGFLRVVSSGPTPEGEERCAYLLYPHRPIVAYLPSTRRLIGEYCVSFEDPDRSYGSGRLPDSDDVLAKWMALTGDEKGLISMANMHLPDRQVNRTQVERDLARLARWDHDQARRGIQASHASHQASLIPSSAS